MPTEMDRYAERIRSMADGELGREWEAQEGFFLRSVEHEMAMRFMRRAKGRTDGYGGRAYFMDKFLRMPEQFREACYRKDWPLAKYIYDSAIIIGQFIEAPEGVRDRVFGSRQDEGRPIEGLFPEDMVNRVLDECVIRNRLGHECIVYRVPGEVGFYGARQLPGTRRMEAWENPACRDAPGRTAAAGGRRDEDGGHIH